MTIGDRIKKQRIKLDMTADELADELGKSRATIYRYENGDIRNLPTTILEPLAQALRTTPAYLMGWTEDPHDWEQIGNDEGIYPPKDYDGSYEDYVKHKIYQESEDLIDSSYDIYDAAVAYLRQCGCQVKDIEGSSDIVIITPTGENLKAKESDLIYNFMVFGPSSPGVKKLITPRKKVDLRDDEEELLIYYNRLNNGGRIEAKKRVNELSMISAYTDKDEKLILKAAHERTDIEVTNEMRKHDDNLMDNDDLWK
ncbi:MAG: helix-turn-helix domain-containing protein [Hungatella sp.]|jgi:transcriptional regulator with XRE-family HTH domain|nr:helix-turn-helix domain-containing protein [Hungatella sp.]